MTRRARLLTTCPVRGNSERKTGLDAIARSHRVLNQPYVVHENIPSDSACRILVARILIVHAERHTGVDGYVGERDLVPIWRHGLKRNRREAAPARMRVSGPDTVDACLCGGRELVCCVVEPMNTRRAVAVVEPVGLVGDVGPSDSSQPITTRLSTTAKALADTP